MDRAMDSPTDLPRLLVSVHEGASLEPSLLEEEILNLFGDLRKPLLRYLCSLGLQIQDGEEIAQEVFIALYQHLRRGKPRTNLRAWIFTTGHHLALRQRMRNERRSRVHCPEEAAENQMDPAPGPEEHTESAERQGLLMAIVRGLPETDRCCLYLRAEGLRYRDIAKTLGISLGAVSLSLGRSLARLASVDKR
jgi:RNA polymerase sigma-70 factor (ECF subfamily)